MWHLKTITEPVLVGTVDMIKKGTDKQIFQIPCNLSIYEIQKLYFAEQFISLEGNYQ